MTEFYKNKAFEVIQAHEGWIYKIKIGMIEFISELFCAEQEARFAAIGHISLLEKGEK